MGFLWQAALLKWLELPSSGWLELFYDGTPSPELATWVKVAIMQDLSIVTENLRAAIASRAQETAAILQYKAAVREAEEKARGLGLPQIEGAPTSPDIDDKGKRSMNPLVLTHSRPTNIAANTFLISSHLYLANYCDNCTASVNATEHICLLFLSG